MTEVLQVETIVQKTAKNKNPFWVLTTSNGDMTCWNKEVVDEIKKTLGNDIEVEVEREGKYTNIVKFCRSDEVKTEKVENKPKQNGNAMMLTSYAKDIFCTMLNCLTHEQNDEMTTGKLETAMIQAIKLVKQAQNEF